MEHFVWTERTFADTRMMDCRWGTFRASVSWHEGESITCAVEEVDDPEEDLFDSVDAGLDFESMEAAVKVCEHVMLGLRGRTLHAELHATRQKLSEAEDLLLRACNDSSQFDLGREVGRSEAAEIMTNCASQFAAGSMSNRALLNCVTSLNVRNRQVKLPDDPAKVRIEELEAYLRTIRKLCDNNAEFGVDPVEILNVVYVALGDKQWPGTS